MIDLSATICTSEQVLSLSNTFAIRLNFQLKEMKNWEFLYTLAGVESSFSANNVCRFEEAYSRRGPFYKKSRALQRAHGLYGDLAAMSYGPWQMMYIVAQELGFGGNPLDLWYGHVSIRWVVEYLNRAHERGAVSVEEFCDAYNSGSHRDSFVPKEYIEKFWEMYETQTKKIVLRGDENG